LWVRSVRREIHSTISDSLDFVSSTAALANVFMAASVILLGWSMISAIKIGPLNISPAKEASGP